MLAFPDRTDAFYHCSQLCLPPTPFDDDFCLKHPIETLNDIFCCETVECHLYIYSSHLISSLLFSSILHVISSLICDCDDHRSQLCTLLDNTSYHTSSLHDESHQLISYLEISSISCFSVMISKVEKSNASLNNSFVQQDGKLLKQMLTVKGADDDESGQYCFKSGKENLTPPIDDDIWQNRFADLIGGIGRRISFSQIFLWMQFFRTFPALLLRETVIFVAYFDSYHHNTRCVSAAAVADVSN
ncbi:hypothetical protein T11_2934 [Trichinella zimbabwensis]|uniref:Uncharacterized protein n=1 Tax=Trichinella zimbabwensis TaxID=268475 RepID=A0A0V1I0L3_9BILA|nr:hypothetical protein T11_2934 [Trichinella zimbabwensis]